MKRNISDIISFNVYKTSIYTYIHISLVLKIAKAQGMSDRILQPLSNMYQVMQRRFKFGGGVGKAFASSNGIVQGCPLSVVLLNVLVNVWATAIKKRVPGVKPTCFADDVGALAHDPAQLQQVLDITGTFAQVTRQKLNPDKSKCWRTCSEGQDLHLKLLESELSQVDTLRSLGAHLAFKGNVKNIVGEQRFRRGAEIARRIQWAPLPMHVRAQLIASLVCPVSLYGITAANVPMSLMKHLGTAVMDAVWGSTRKLRCREVVMTLFVPGHRVDPEMASMYQCLCALRKFMSCRPHVNQIVHEIWAFYQHEISNHAHAHGPIQLVHKTLTCMGWSWSQPHCFTRPGHSLLPIVGCDQVWWEHQIRDGLRLTLWKRAGQRRQDMQGLENDWGVDRLATMSVCNSTKTKPYDSGILRSIISGSVRLQQRLHVAGLVDSAVCTFCGMAEETLEHCFWQCPCWDVVRSKFWIPARRIVESWPKCTVDCAIFLEHQEVVDLSAELESEEARVNELIESWSAMQVVVSSVDIGEMRNDDGKKVVWTDGASRNNQDARVRRAGCGVFYASDHVRNFSCILPGLVQSNQRAELLAVVLALRRDPSSMEIRTDSQYVFNGACAWQSWCARGWRGANTDLWRLFSQAMADRSPGSASFTKVLGHATKIDVQRGRVLACDKLGNDGADEYACTGADQHAVPASILQDLKLRRAAAVEVQSMMVEILKTRRIRAPAQAPVSDDVEAEHELLLYPSDVLPQDSVPSDSG